VCNFKVLDLCCGKGGDLGKFLSCTSVRMYRGVDISDSSIHEAIRRSATYNKNQAILTFVTCDVEKTIGVDETAVDKHFGCQNWCNEYHIVNMQFALHYFCKSKKIFETLVQRIASCLDLNGLWIGTFPNFEHVRASLNGTYLLPEYCKIAKVPGWRKNRGIGNPYSFYLEGGVPNLKEYMLPLQIFRNVVEKHGFSIVLLDSVEACLQNYKKNTSSVLSGIQQVYPNYTTLDFNVTQLYQAFIVRKIR
jgi:SAM-dependent methyltransferase